VDAPGKIIGIVTAPGQRAVVAIAVTVFENEGPAQRQAVARNRQIDRAGAQYAVEIAVEHFEMSAQFVGRFGADDIDRARSAVATIKRALRPAQYLDPFEIEEIGIGTRQPRNIGPVDVERGGRIGFVAVVGARNPTDGDEHRIAAGFVGEVHVG